MAIIMGNKVKYSEKGQNLMLFAAGFSAIMTLLMLMVDFGGAAMTYHKAQITADAAAYSAAQAVDINLFYQTNQVKLDPGIAQSIAGRFATINATDNKVNMQFVGVYVSNDRVWVRAIAFYDSFFAHFIGLSTIKMEIIASASPAFGIDTRGQ